MKSLFIFLLLLPFAAFSQIPLTTEYRDTFPVMVLMFDSICIDVVQPLTDGEIAHWQRPLIAVPATCYRVRTREAITHTFISDLDGSVLDDERIFVAKQQRPKKNENRSN